MRLGVFIPGRLQSERLSRKLVKTFGDESCLWDIACYKLEKISKRFETAVLCSDYELLDIARGYSNINVIYRDVDTTKVDGPLNFIFKDISSMKSSHIMFLNPCLPLLRVETIVAALDFFKIKSLDYMESVRSFKNWVFDSNHKPVNPIDFTRLSTKELDTWYLDANAFRVFDKGSFLRDGYMLKDGFSIYPISDLESIDVDTKEDFVLANAVFSAVGGV